METSKKKPATMQVKILGTGCPNCRRLERNAREAIEQLGRDVQVDKIEDITDILNYGVMRTPALVAGDKVLVSGRVPSVDELSDLLSRLP